MSKYLVQIIVLGSQIIGRAFARALREEYAASKQAARKAGSSEEGTRRVASDFRSGITLEESLQILNAQKVNDSEAIERNYKYLMEANDRSKGGSFYLQSKVFRAKERIDEELKNKKTSKTKSQSQSES